MSGNELIVRPLDSKAVKLEEENIVLRDWLTHLAHAPGAPAWVKDGSARALDGVLDVGTGVGPIKFPAGLHVVMVEDDNPDRGGSAMIWETNCEPDTAPRRNAAIQHAERLNGKYGRALVCKVTPVLALCPEGWVECGEDGQPLPTVASAPTAAAIEVVHVEADNPSADCSQDLWSRWLSAPKTCRRCGLGPCSQS